MDKLAWLHAFVLYGLDFPFLWKRWPSKRIYCAAKTYVSETRWQIIEILENKNIGHVTRTLSFQQIFKDRSSNKNI